MHAFIFCKGAPVVSRPHAAVQADYAGALNNMCNGMYLLVEVLRIVYAKAPRNIYTGKQFFFDDERVRWNHRFVPFFKTRAPMPIQYQEYVNAVSFGDKAYPVRCRTRVLACSLVLTSACVCGFSREPLQMWQ